MKKLLTTIAVAAGLATSLENAAATIVLMSPAPFTGEQNFLQFNTTSLSLSPSNSPGVGYVLRLDWSRSIMNYEYQLALGAWNSNYSNSGFTQDPIIANSVVNNASTYVEYQVTTNEPNGAYYGFKYATGEISAPVFYYGWVNLTAGSDNQLTLNSAAINTTAGASILAGQTTSTAVPEPGSWVPSVLLVLAGALRRRRPRRAKVAGA
jgi:hypothetical protein